MAFFFGESFDAYSTPADMALGYWDTSSTIGGGSNYFAPGRFTGQCLYSTTGIAQKTSGSNDPIHHFSVAFRQVQALSGTLAGSCIQLQDGATNQCCLYFRTDGGIYLTRGAWNGTVVASYTPAFGANQWNQYEIEVVISTTVGRLRIRVNGNTTEDYDSGATLNTQATANAYVNRISFANYQGVTGQQVDDFIWRSDTAPLPWIGDLRCFTRRPAADVQAQWARSSSSSFTLLSFPGTGANTSFGTNVARYMPFTSPGGSISSVILPLVANYTGNVKCTIFADSATHTPGAIIQSATAPIANPVTGSNTFTFSPPVVIPAGQSFWVALCVDVNSGSALWPVGSGLSQSYQTNGTPNYAAFPVANPAGGTTNNAPGALHPVITVDSNANMVADGTQDALTTYVSSLTVGQTDLYSLSGIDSTPASVFAITTRAYLQKTDAGTRTVAVLLKSGATTVQAPGVPNTSWNWVSRTDFTDPNGGGPLTAIGVNNMQIGVQVTA